jgi:putative ABC transport system substrate-binding protein
LLRSPLRRSRRRGCRGFGFLAFGPAPSASQPANEAFFEGLRELGYREGDNVVVERRYADLKPERIPVLATELVHLKVDVIVTTGDGEVRAARRATSTIPIVMAVSGDPVRAGYVASLARPGGNVTGLSYLSPEMRSASPRPRARRNA